MGFATKSRPSREQIPARPRGQQPSVGSLRRRRELEGGESPGHVCQRLQTGVLMLAHHRDCCFQRIPMMSDFAQRFLLDCFECRDVLLPVADDL